jgi:drug/metabolite transporter (DMT)-like permease
MSTQPPKPWIIWGSVILLALTWGSSFILMKRGLVSFSPLQVGSLRLVFSIVFTFALAFRYLKYFKRADTKWLLASGYLGSGIPLLMFPYAVSKLDSSFVGILNSLVPLFTLILGGWFFHRHVRRVQVWGVIMGLLGAFLLIFPKVQMTWDTRVAYSLLPVVATVLYAFNVNIVQSKLRHLPSGALTLLSTLPVLPYALIVLGLTGFPATMATEPLAWESLGYVALLGILGSSLAVFLFNWLIIKTSALFASSVTYLIPVVALMWGLLDGEPVGLPHLMGLTGILLGVYLVNLRK